VSGPKPNSPAAAATAIGAKEDTSPSSRITETPSSAVIKPEASARTRPTADMVKGFDRFVATITREAFLDWARRLASYPSSEEYKRASLQWCQGAKTRLTLASLAKAQMRETFVATVAGRGFIRERRTVLLKDLRIFGCKFIHEDHLWLVYDKRWARVEPFYQGQKVVLVGTVVEYTRKNTTWDYTLALEKVTELWTAPN
jgi:hypothetical protein